MEMECEWLMEQPRFTSPCRCVARFSTPKPELKTPFDFKKLSASAPAHGLHPTEMAADGGSPVLDVSVASAFSSSSVAEDESK